MDWGHLEYFLAVARAGSLSGAAKQLGVNHSTVSRRIERLEQQLSVRLFKRVNNGYTLTEDGHVLCRQSSRIEEQVNQIEDTFNSGESDLHGTLKVSKPGSGTLNLALLFAEFHRQYPHIEIELSAGGAHTEVGRHESDVAIRLTDTPPPDVVSRKVGTLPMHIYGSKEYLKHAGTTDPKLCDWVVWSAEGSPLTMEANIKRDIPEARIVLRTTCPNELYEAVIGGVGISYISPLRLPPKHQLQALAVDKFTFELGVWLLSHPDLRNRRRVKVFKDFMVEHLGEFLR